MVPASANRAELNEAILQVGSAATTSDATTPSSAKFAVFAAPSTIASGRFAAVESSCAPAGMLPLTGAASNVVIVAEYVPGVRYTTIVHVVAPASIEHAFEFGVRPTDVVRFCGPVNTSVAPLVDGETYRACRCRCGIRIRTVKLALP